MEGSDLWLPVGAHWDLNIEHGELADAGPFTGGGWKLTWHTTESGWDSVDAMWRVLRDKRAAPHFVIGGRVGLKYPVVIQMIPLNRAGRALAHPSGPETNRANTIQIEICGRAAESGSWDRNRYAALANLALLIEHRVDIPQKAPRSFPGVRYSGAGFVKARGHVGHCHVPGNDHWDPGKFKRNLLLSLMADGKQQLRATMTAEDRLSRLEQDVAFVARLIFLREAGHATPAEVTRLREIAGRYPRESVMTDPHNATP